MIRRGLPFLATVPLAFCLPARAQVQVIHTDITAFEQTADGKPSSCGLDYVVIHSEHLYRKGRPVALSGSFTWSVTDDHRMFMLHKLVGADFGSDPTKPFPFSPNYDFLSTDVRSFSRTELSYFLGENGGKIAGYNIDVGAEIFATLLRGGPLYVSYNRAPRDQDVRVPLIGPAAISASEANKLSRCMRAIVDRAGAN